MSRSTTIRRILVSHFPSRGVEAIELSEEESIHLTSVLRLAHGDPVEAIDGNGQWAPAHIEMRKKRAFVLVDSQKICTATDELRLPLVLEASLLKGDAMDWLIEKAVELGVEEFQPLVMEHSVVRVKSDRQPEEFQFRWQRIADQALKQCGRRFRLRVRLPLSLQEYLSQCKPTENRIWLNESARDDAPVLSHWLSTQKELGRTHILLGPEGGFSYAEKELLQRTSGIRSVSLGPLVLRAETAGLAATAQFAGEWLRRVKAPLGGKQ